MQQNEAPPTPSTIEAAVSLLGDADRKVVDACRHQLLRWGSVALPELRRGAESADPRLRLRARSVLRTLELQDWLASIADFAARHRGIMPGREGWTFLEEGAHLISSVTGPPQLGRREVGNVLDGLAERLRTRLRARTATTVARALADLMSNHERFCGERSSYYELDSVLVDQVLRRRKGVPVSLSILYVLVGRRAKLPLSGVSMPEHFLVRVHGARPVLVDPFHEGRTVTKADCVRYLRSAGYGFRSSFLEEVDDRRILLAHLGDLQRVYGYREDREVSVVLRRAREHLEEI